MLHHLTCVKYETTVTYRFYVTDSSEMPIGYICLSIKKLMCTSSKQFVNLINTKLHHISLRRQRTILSLHTKLCLKNFVFIQTLFYVLINQYVTLTLCEIISFT